MSSAEKLEAFIREELGDRQGFDFDRVAELIDDVMAEGRAGAWEEVANRDQVVGENIELRNQLHRKQELLKQRTIERDKALSERDQMQAELDDLRAKVRQYVKGA